MTKISELTSIVTAAATDIIAVVQGGVTKRATVQDYRDAGIIPTADQAAALAAYEAALAAAEAGQVLTASGPGAAAFAAAAGGGASLSDYSNVIVVDAGGNGDYNTIKAAIDAAPNGSVIIAFGALAAEPVTVVNKTLTILAYAANVDIGTMTLQSGANLTLEGNFSNSGSGTVVSAGSLKLKNFYGPEVSIQIQAQISNLEISHAVIGTFGLTAAPPTTAKIMWTRIVTALICAPAWNPAPIYHCILPATILGMTPHAGTANGSNIII